MKIIALICCRSGSKGIKNKNLKKFLGKPILEWISKEIKKTKIFDSVLLSSDSVKICNLGDKLGMITDLRPKRLAKSTSDVFDAQKYIFKKFKIKDKDFLICCINNTPFIKKNHILKTFKIFKKNKFKRIVMLAKKIDMENIYFRQASKKNDILYPIFKKVLINSKINRQNQSESFVNIGDLRWASAKSLSSYKEFNKDISKNGYSFLEVKNNDYIDLNNESDWKIALNRFKK